MIIYENTLNVLGASIEARFVKQDIYSFGPRSAKSHTLRGSECKGFINALGNVMDDFYPVLIPGFHAKFDWESLSLETENEARAYVNFDILTDKDVLEKLTGFGITKQAKVGWLVLNTRWGRIVPAFYAQPKTSLDVLRPSLDANYDELSKDDQKVARNNARIGLHPDVLERNEHHWNIVHKHNGLEWILRMVKGGTRIVCDVHIDGFECQDKAILEKFARLFGNAEERSEAYGKTIRHQQDQKFTNVGGFYVRQGGALAQAAEAQIAVSGISYFDKGELVTDGDLASLVRKTVTYQRGGSITRHQVWLRDTDTVKAALLYCETNGLTIHF